MDYQAPPPVIAPAPAPATNTAPSVPYTIGTNRGTVRFSNPFAGHFADKGIPPKIYGQYYVKPGTHKRTNKRK